MRTNKPGFSFNGIWAVTQSVELLERPKIPRPALRGQSVVIPGRSGDVWLPDDAYNNVSFDLKCRAKRGANLSEISAWLTGFGDLEFSFIPGLCYRARLTAEYQYERFLPGCSPHNFTLKCDCHPFRYQATPEVRTLTEPTILRNPGTRWSRPIIRLFGTGNANLIIGETEIQLSGLTGGITIDSQVDEAYWGEQSMNRFMSGDFPRLALGRTPISWSGNVTSIEISPNWRWL